MTTDRDSEGKRTNNGELTRFPHEEGGPDGWLNIQEAVFAMNGNVDGLATPQWTATYSAMDSNVNGTTAPQWTAT